MKSNITHTKNSSSYGVIIGRFQPFHTGHKEIVHKALERVDKLVILIGSASGPRTFKNPWTFEERYKMIEESIPADDYKNISIIPLEDNLYNDQDWIKSIQKSVSKITGNSRDITLIGHNKDSSSYYLNLFPQWKLLRLDNYENISAVDIRQEYFSSDSKTKHVTKEVQKSLETFRESEIYKTLKEEKEYIDKYKESWSSSPYNPTFVTADALVVQAGHILLIKRRSMPGKGLYALPGGFVDTNETIQDSAIRELKEETKIKVPKQVLEGCITKQQVYDSPSRSQRGRSITHAFLIELREKELPRIKGSSDAAKAKWVPISEVVSNNMFGDHYHIIRHLLG